MLQRNARIYVPSQYRCDIGRLCVVSFGPWGSVSVRGLSVALMGGVKLTSRDNVDGWAHRNSALSVRRWRPMMKIMERRVETKFHTMRHTGHVSARTNYRTTELNCWEVLSETSVSRLVKIMEQSALMMYPLSLLIWSIESSWSDESPPATHTLWQIDISLAQPHSCLSTQL